MNIRKPVAFVFLLCALLIMSVFISRPSPAAGADTSDSDSDAVRTFDDVLPSAGADDFDISCTTGDSPFISSQYGSYPLRVRVTNNSGRDFDGVLKLSFPSEKGIDDPVAMAKDILVQSDKSEDIDFRLDSSYFSYTGMNDYIYIRADILDGSGNLVIKKGFIIENKGRDNNGLFITGIMSKSKKKFAGESNIILKYPSNEYYKSDYTDEETDTYSADIVIFSPSDAGSYDLSVFAVIIADTDPGKGSWTDLSEWVISGGMLVIDRDTAGKYIDVPKDSDSISFGDGWIFFFDSKGDENLSDYGTICSDLISSKRIDSISSKYSYFSDYTGNYIDKDITDAKPNIAVYALIFAIFIVIICPVMYFVLKKKDRMEYLWGLIPICAVIFSAIVYAAGSRYRMKSLSGEYFSKVVLSEEGSFEKSLIKTVNPGRGSAVYTLSPDYTKVSYFPYTSELSGIFSMFNNDGAVVTASNSDTSAEEIGELLRSNYKTAIALTDDGTDIISGTGRIFYENSIVASRHTRVSDGLETDLSIWDGGMSGSIVNSTPYDIHDAFVMHSDFVYYIGDLPAGETVSVKGVQGQTFSSLNFSTDSTDQGEQFIRDMDVYGFGNETAAMNAVNYMMSELYNALGDDNVIAGFTADYDIGLDKGQFDKLSGLSMLCEYTDITQKTDKWMNTDPLWGIPLTEEDNTKYSPSGHSIYEDDIDLVYQIDEDQPVDRLIWVNTQDHSLLLTFYNNRTGKYEPVMNSSNSMSGDELKDYINDKKQILVNAKFNPDAVTYNLQFTIPAFDISGGDRND